MPENGLLRVLTPDQVEAQRKEKEAAIGAIELLPQKQDFQNSLASYIRNCWEEAKNEKIPVEEQMLKNMRQIAAEYETDLKSISPFSAYEVEMFSSLAMASLWRLCGVFGVFVAC